MKIKLLKLATLMLFVVLPIVPSAYGIGHIDNYDFDVGPESGSWTYAAVAGWWYPPMVYNIVHDKDYDLAPGYWGIADYEYVPLEQGDDWYYGWTRMTLDVRQDTKQIEIVESFASIPFL